MREKRVFTYCPPELRSKEKDLPVFSVYPDYWKKTWGEIPLLGYVKEESAYWAKYAAYDGRLLPYNATFGPKVVAVGEKPPVNTGVIKKKKYEANNKTKRT